MISPEGMRGKGIGSADRPVVPAVPRPREPLGSLATSTALRFKTARYSSEGPRPWPHASHRARSGSCSWLRDMPALRPYGPLGHLGLPQSEAGSPSRP